MHVKHVDFKALCDYAKLLCLMNSMDDVKRENNEVRRSKSEVKNVVTGYLHKRNYTTLQTFESTKNEQITHSLLESGVGRSNSILYSCYNSDPLVIDQNFTKFLLWLKDQTKHKNHCHDVEQIVGPLFCHLYIDIVGGGHSERAASFLKCHLPAIDKGKCDCTVRDLINLFSSDGDITKLKEKFRSKKIVIELKEQSLAVLKKFVLESCHVLFLQILQSWFDFEKCNDKETSAKDIEKMIADDVLKDSKFQELLNAIKNLKKEPLPIYNIKISNNKQAISCGLLKRQCGLVALSENNVLKLVPIHSLDSLFSQVHYKELKFTNHSGQIYSIAVSPNNSKLISASADHSICIYDLIDMKLLKKCTGHLGPVYCVKISSNGEYLVTGSMDTTARLWDITNGKTLRVFSGHTQAITCLDFHPNCLYIATGSADRNIRLWSLSKASPMRLLHAAKGTIYDLAFNPSGRFLASASEDKKIRVWDLLTSKIVVELRCKDTPVVQLIWSCDGAELCAGTIDGVIRVWNFANMQSHTGNNKYHEPILIQPLNSKLLCLEYTLGTYGTLTM
ncbi:TAF5-like RNA polymerase II p300/CBP-associated factor-associated factor 65 kDa subunit 5L [Anoplophora glabripennis]|uniref:TAF5-like RNA polymerase II p300/CBP-associated factor-associated factor 65 kDa subunit 5L n=1 Tax=Anoplophora glabripennis TaxID=217634 RepID=UPI000873B86C|nr:TAF5-like RNA polymerase II p300/CBP-associated factor-associated factor 65 kDa subunit 5L [Anoplophora glabripennis]